MINQAYETIYKAILSRMRHGCKENRYRKVNNNATLLRIKNERM